VVVDANFLCHQAGRAMPSLKVDDVASGVTFGVLSRVLTFAARAKTNRFAFCWDGRHSYRRAAFDWYKDRGGGDEVTDEERELRQAIYSQMNCLRDEIIPAIGFRNSFSQHGIEADDTIAHIIFNSHPIEKSVLIISSDHDLYQLLRPGVRMLDAARHKAVDGAWLEREWGVTWDKWGEVKALAGCKSDTVPGIPGVKEKTAIQYLKGELPTKYKRYQAIVSADGQAVYHRNLGLVKLPHEMSKPVTLGSDELTEDGFNDVCNEYQLHSLLKNGEGRRFLFG